jgi:hypothetical protein
LHVSYLYESPLWRRTILMVLQRDKLCGVCGTAKPRMAAHIQKPSDEKMFWDVRNIRGECKPCFKKRVKT